MLHDYQCPIVRHRRSLRLTCVYWRHWSAAKRHSAAAAAAAADAVTSAAAASSVDCCCYCRHRRRLRRHPAELRAQHASALHRKRTVSDSISGHTQSVSQPVG